MTIKISSKMPKGDQSGLGPIISDLIDTPHRVHVLIALIDCKGTTTDYDSGEIIPTARIRRVEVVRRADLPEAERLVRRALEDRSGKTVLPLELEDELTIAFSGVDPRTGEVIDGPKATDGPQFSGGE